MHDWKGDDHHYGKKSSSNTNDEMMQLLMHYGRPYAQESDMDFEEPLPRYKGNAGRMSVLHPPSSSDG